MQIIPDEKWCIIKSVAIIYMKKRTGLLELFGRLAATWEQYLGLQIPDIHPLINITAPEQTISNPFANQLIIIIRTLNGQIPATTDPLKN